MSQHARHMMGVRGQAGGGLGIVGEVRSALAGACLGVLSIK